MGDIIYSLPTIISYNCDAILSLRKEYHFQFLYTLLIRQPYLCNVVFNKAHGNDFVNLDKFRRIEKRARSRGKIKHLAKAHLEANKKDFDLTECWLFNITPTYAADIVVNRSLRYHDKEEIDWSLLQYYDVLFLGFEEEYIKFCEIAKFKPKFFYCFDALDMASLIMGSKLFIGNQSFGFALAEAMKHPRILEIYYRADNCRPNGKDGYYYLSNELIKDYING